MKKLIEIINNRKVFLFGAGTCGIKTKEILERSNIVITGYFDNNVENLKIDNKIMKASNINYFDNLQETFVIISSSYNYEISRQLKKIGLIYQDDYVHYNQLIEKEGEIYILAYQEQLTEKFQFSVKKETLSSTKHYYNLPQVLNNEAIYENRKTNVIYPNHPFNTEEPFYVIFQNGYVYGLNSNVFSREGEQFLDFGYSGEVNPFTDVWDSKKLEFYNSIDNFVEPYSYNIEGKVGIVATRYAANNYFHWLFEELPRFYLLKKTNHDMDYYLSSYSGNDYQLETLQLLGIHPERIITAQQSTHIHLIQAKDMYVPYNPVNDFGYFPKWIIDFLKGMWSVEELKNVNSPKKIYVSRKDAKSRKIIEEESLIEFLREEGFEEVILTGLSVKEKAELFYNATHIISPYGAALANIVFCKPKTYVLEIFNPKRITSVYMALSGQVNLNHHTFIGETTEISNSSNPNLLDIEIDIKRFIQFYNIAFEKTNTCER